MIQPRLEDKFAAMRASAVGIFLIATALFVALGGWLLAGHDRFVLHQLLNGCHGPIGDRSMPWFTHFADGITVAVVGLVLLLHSYRASLMVLLAAGLSAVLTQVLKHTLFSFADRPIMFLDRMPDLQLVAGLEQHNHNSFPSGHTTAAFSMCFALCVIIGRPRWALPLALFAMSLGYSRIYLSQHFAADVVAGAAIGTLVGWGVYRLLYTGGLVERSELEGSLRRR